MNIYTKIAKESVEKYIQTKEIMEILEDLPADFLSLQKGVFVTIYKKAGNIKELRGCIGTVSPTRENVAEEIIQNAIWAAAEDFRFTPIQENELGDLEYEVSLLNPPEAISSPKELDTKKFGVIVRTKDGRSGLLLPDIEGVELPEEQIEIACQKGGIDIAEKFDLYRFTIDKYKQENER
jgi:AmmeMemoRadiSam system protein A